MGYLSRISQVEYQLKRNLTWTPTDEQYVEMSLSILYSILNAAHVKEEDVQGAVTTGTLPTEFLGVTIVWDTGENAGYEFSLNKGDIEATQDIRTPIYKFMSLTEELENAIIIALQINGLTEDAPDVGYTYIDNDILKNDALSLTLEIKGVI